MADLLQFHLLHPKQWREWESSPLRWDRHLSDLAKSACPEDSPCLPTIKFLTESTPMILIFTVVCAFLLWRYSRHLRPRLQKTLLISTGAAIGLGDFFSNQLKYFFSRMRPDHELYFLDIGIRPAYSFPSNHAFNLFAMATLFFLYQRRGYLRGVKFPMGVFVLALLVAISRVFVGRHFPLDIVAGFVFGGLYALLAAFIIGKFVPPSRR